MLHRSRYLLERDAEFWSKKITEVEVERRGYHRLAVKGHMTDEELVAALSELDEIRETAERELEAAQGRGFSDWSKTGTR